MYYAYTNEGTSTNTQTRPQERKIKAQFFGCLAGCSLCDPRVIKKTFLEQNVFVKTFKKSCSLASAGGDWCACASES